RVPAKTQSALLEAMQEQQVTIEGETRHLGKPFMVLATQNPVEHEGTYPLPEAQVDRFLIKLTMSYPSAEDEKRMLATYNQPVAELSPLIGPDDLLRLQTIADDVHVSDEVFDYVLGLVKFTREHQSVYLGASPRASLALLKAAKALGLIRGRDYVLPDDVQALAALVLTHRIIMTPDAELDGIDPRTVIREAIDRTAYKTPARRA
ncbi:MAG: MoxR family ATPase, partial [Deltaproteobacteria bacterium]|nr:MoxR family ATPase [Deltaproteobacteria bacterium]